MKNKLFFLQLEDNTVHLTENVKTEEICDFVPDSWMKIISAKEKKARCQATIELWEKYLGRSLPNVIKRFKKELDNVELLDRCANGGIRYSLLYSMIDESWQCIYYEGRNPMDNISVRSNLGYWSNMPQRIRDFYEHIHDGFYHYMNRGMGLQPMRFTHFVEPRDEVTKLNIRFGSEVDDDVDEAQEWNLEAGDYDGLWEEDSHQMAFFWNSLGLAVSMDDREDSEKNAIIWKSVSPPKFHNEFWKIVDQLLLYF